MKAKFAAFALLMLGAVSVQAQKEEADDMYFFTSDRTPVAKATAPPIKDEPASQAKFSNPDYTPQRPGNNGQQYGYYEPNYGSANGGNTYINNYYNGGVWSRPGWAYGSSAAMRWRNNCNTCNGGASDFGWFGGTNAYGAWYGFTPSVNIYIGRSWGNSWGNSWNDCNAYSYYSNSWNNGWNSPFMGGGWAPGWGNYYGGSYGGTYGYGGGGNGGGFGCPTIGNGGNNGGGYYTGGGGYVSQPGVTRGTRNDRSTYVPTRGNSGTVTANNNPTRTYSPRNTSGRSGQVVRSGATGVTRSDQGGRYGSPANTGGRPSYNTGGNSGGSRPSYNNGGGNSGGSRPSYTPSNGGGNSGGSRPSYTPSNSGGGSRPSGGGGNSGGSGGGNSGGRSGSSSPSKPSGGSSGRGGRG